MGKGQSKPELAYIEPIPVAYDLDRATTRPLSPVILSHSSEYLPRPRQRSQSLHSLPDRTMATRWKSAPPRKDILDKKAYYLGRFQTKAISEAILIELRRSLLRAKRRKTRIKLSPLGFSFGTKPGGLLNTDKVPYQFVPLEFIETLRLDSVMREVLLCVFRIDHQRSNPQNGPVDPAVAQHYEINAFHVDPRDAVQYQRAHDDFKVKGPLYQQMSNGSNMKTLSVSHGHIADYDGWRGARTNNNTLIMPPARTEREIRTRSTSETHHHVPSPDYVDSSSSFIYSGAQLGHTAGYSYQAKTYHVATEPMYPADSNSILTHSNGSSITRRVYFNQDIPVADVETQVSPEATSTSERTSRSSYDTSNSHRPRSSSQSSNTGRSNNDSVKRRIRDLSREMDQLRTMIDVSDDERPVQNGIEDIVEESSTSSDSTIRGLATRINPPQSVVQPHGHAGTIDTRMGKVDVMVDDAPAMYNRRHNTVDGYLSESQMFAHNGPNRRIRRRPSERSHTDSEVGGRYVYYRPVVQEPVQVYRREQVRPRSVEPQGRRKKGWFR